MVRCSECGQEIQCSWDIYFRNKRKKCICDRCYLYAIVDNYGIGFLKSLMKRGYYRSPCTGKEYSLEDIKKIIIVEEL